MSNKTKKSESAVVFSPEPTATLVPNRELGGPHKREKPYQTTMFVQLDPDVALEDFVVLKGDWRWQECMHELATASWVCVDCEFYSTRSGPWGSRRDIDYWRSSIRLLQVGLPSGRVLVFDFGGLLDDRTAKMAEYINDLPTLQRVIEDQNVPKAGMALLTEYLLLRIHFGWKMRCMRDIMIMSQVVFAGIGSKAARWTDKGLVVQAVLRHSMSAICERLSIPVDKREQMSDWAGKLARRQYNYAARDVIVPRAAWVALAKMAKQDGLMNSLQAECDAQPAFCECEYNGLPIDIEQAKADLDKWAEVRDGFLKPFTVLFPRVNPAAPAQVAQALTEALDVYACTCASRYDPLDQEPKGQPLSAQPDSFKCHHCGEGKAAFKPTNERSFLVPKEVRGKPTMQPTTSDDVLAPYAHIWYVNALLEWRSANTCRNWLKAAVEHAFVAPDGGGLRIRADFKQIAGGYSEHGSVDGELGRGMGRSSASRPINTQNPSNLQPAHEKAGAPSVRRSIKPRKGQAFIVADLSQAHWRIAAQWSKDPVMLRDCIAGRDAHLAMTHRVMVANGAKITLEEAETIKEDKNHPLHLEFKARRQGTKSTNYACMNMTGAKTLKKQMETMAVPVYMEEPEVQKMIEIWRHEVYRKLYQAQRTHIKRVNAHSHHFTKYGIEGEYGEARALTGRRLYLVKEWKRPHQRDDGTWSEGYWSVKGTDSVSFVWMGTEADLIKRAMGWLVPIFDANPAWDVRWANMAHDEIDLTCAEKHALIVATVVQEKFHEAMRWAGIVDLPVDEKGATPTKLIKTDWSAK